MLPDNQHQLLNRLAALHHRSLPTYLTYAKPWIPVGQEDDAHVIDDIAADHHELVERVLQVLEKDDRPIHLGDFPMDYTDLNDLSLSYILNELKIYERKLLATLEEMALWADKDGPAFRLVQRATGLAVGHLQNLEEMGTQAPSIRP
ncbi:hypothetical protein DTL42_14475 [Bremerella cremea]|uniref:Ferritin-like domain-containing protein n=1 Tax=Bremerella cremea TaxID=1031537 RepID=A0A368KPY9_9BACT|nr:hypothetical protein [Bremerella cremea]RCS47719.1 hypothetical protein DTL42_14475 [Bremerella cremea]